MSLRGLMYYCINRHPNSKHVRMFSSMLWLQIGQKSIVLDQAYLISK